MHHVDIQTCQSQLALSRATPKFWPWVNKAHLTGNSYSHSHRANLCKNSPSQGSVSSQLPTSVYLAAQVGCRQLIASKIDLHQLRAHFISGSLTTLRYIWKHAQLPHAVPCSSCTRNTTSKDLKPREIADFPWTEAVPLVKMCINGPRMIWGHPIFLSSHEHSRQCKITEDPQGLEGWKESVLSRP